ncbi:hypothetical protein SG34_020135 [Thalassomonas viridans]|uniref:Uncharacterized protein n=1 Tax=Thalassomonas viridans TaxID=137584 RepID=A0AAF0C7G6_9GAMM|nr:hypothetical protein [Thalassomonas viridans]WDE03673.1 hypothetical protein SG34_020135 [Thalassomonas viridans]
MSEVIEVSEGRHTLVMTRQEAFESVHYLIEQLQKNDGDRIELYSVSDDAPEIWEM